MGRQSAFNELEKGKIVAFKDQGLLARAIAKNLERSPGAILNFLLFQENC